jgi:hypothetical protein
MGKYWLIISINYISFTGWWLSPTPLKNMKVSWDYYSIYCGKNVPNHQPNNNLSMIITYQLNYIRMFLTLNPTKMIKNKN